MNKILIVVFLYIALIGCATQPIEEQASDPKTRELQLLLQAELLASQGDVEASAEVYYELAMESESEEIFNKSFLMLSLAKHHSEAKDIAVRWNIIYKNRESMQAMIINDMFRQDYQQALTDMDSYTEQYKEEVYSLALNFIPTMVDSKKTEFYDGLKIRYQNNNPFVINTLIPLGVSKINSLLKQEELALAQSEVDYLLGILDKNKGRKGYLLQKQALLIAYLEIDKAIDLDILPSKYEKFLTTAEDIDNFYILLAEALALFPDEEKIKLTEKLLLRVADNKKTEEKFLIKIESIHLAKSLRIKSVLQKYSNYKAVASKEIYLKNLALFANGKAPVMSELKKMINNDYILGGLLSLEYYISTNNDKQAQKQLNLLMDKFPERRDLVVLEYLRILEQYKKYHKILTAATAEIEGLGERKWDSYAENLYFMKAIAYAGQDNYESMEKDFKYILEQNPNSAMALNGWGYSLVDKNEELSQASKMIATAMKLEPDNVGILDSVAWLEYRYEEFENALRILLKCYGASGENEVAYHLAEVYLALGEIEKAEKLAHKIWLSEPKYQYLKGFKDKLEKAKQEMKEVKK